MSQLQDCSLKLLGISFNSNPFDFYFKLYPFWFPNHELHAVAYLLVNNQQTTTLVSQLLQTSEVTQ